MIVGAAWVVAAAGGVSVGDAWVGAAAGWVGAAAGWLGAGEGEPLSGESWSVPSSPSSSTAPSVAQDPALVVVALAVMSQPITRDELVVVQLEESPSAEVQDTQKSVTVDSEHEVDSGSGSGPGSGPGPGPGSGVGGPWGSGSAGSMKPGGGGILQTIQGSASPIVDIPWRCDINAFHQEP